jgi:hypothetical protein
MNLGVTLAVYASICREKGLPFRFPRSEFQWNCLKDITDARLLARHIEWAALSPQAWNQELNVVNGDQFRWRWMWERIAAWFAIEPSGPEEVRIPLADRLDGSGDIWTEIAGRYGLAEANIERLASPWHSDAVLGLPIEGVVDMSKSRSLGFLEYMRSEESFIDLFKRLHEERLIPDPRSR